MRFTDWRLGALSCQLIGAGAEAGRTDAERGRRLLGWAAARRVPRGQRDSEGPASSGLGGKGLSGAFLLLREGKGSPQVLLCRLGRSDARRRMAAASPALPAPGRGEAEEFSQGWG